MLQITQKTYERVEKHIKALEDENKALKHRIYKAQVALL